MTNNNGNSLGETKGRESFKSSFGLLAAAVGSAVGLGNIWRFPYITGVNGGGAFLIIYLFCVVAIGLPVMLAEFVIGREGKKDAIGSFKYLAPGKKWYISGVLGVLAAFFILSFYGVIAGWTLEYIVSAAGNQFAGKSAAEIGGFFTSFISSPIKPIIWQVVFMSITAIIVATGVEKGIEKFSKLMIPLLLLIIIILDIRALTLPGGMAGIEFLFKPDFSKINGKVILAALGHAFFSLSLGMGIMITYGSYIPKEEKLGKTALKVSIADTLIALLAGVAIFPAVFAFGIAPDSGPGLVFITLPNVFAQMPGGYFFSIMFFLLLALAALTSTISLLEVVVAYIIETFKMERKKATLISATLITLIGMVASLSNGNLSYIQIFGKNIFDFIDYLTANYFLTTGAFLSSIFFAWKLDKEVIKNQLTNQGAFQVDYIKAFYFLLKFVAPIGIIFVFLTEVGLI
ncbi:sodium-dependent transporter [Tissierella sp. MSJ-40]|uniref:Transporter n=1 Tax=Tissierella simiarum TaxID=2841534 RepID=A0ABS6EA09_9FIRM|nr:sodium-dependent transporter [Tissierella simiarum]MBU5439371.1 sodium-dependent transporter [Tissierella simiarum]